jgi:hypothetical protein
MTRIVAPKRFVAQTPPRDLVAKWAEDAPDCLPEAFMHIAFGSAQWAARRELERCVQLLLEWHNTDEHEHPAIYLCNARKLDLSNLRERILEKAIAVLDKMLEQDPCAGEIVIEAKSLNLIKSALNLYPD